MDTKLSELENIDAFQDLDHTEVEEVGQQTRMMDYKAGYLFYMPNDPGEVLFILKQGRVQLYRMSSDGRKLVIAELHPGAIFGHMALVGQRMHNTFAQALTDCRICHWDRDYVESMLLEKPQIALRLLEAVGQRLIQAEEGLVETTFQTISSRLAGLLLRTNERYQAEGRLIGFTHQYFADMLGTYRETATQALNDFKQRNLISIGRMYIEILDEEGLKKIAAS